MQSALLGAEALQQVLLARPLNCLWRVLGVATMVPSLMLVPVVPIGAARLSATIRVNSISVIALV